MAVRDATTLTVLHRRRASVPTLSLVASAGAGEIRCPLGLEPVIAGTAADCDLVIRDPSVSRRHCSFTLGPRGVEVRDLGSKNGTSISGVEITSGFLTTAGAVQIGEAIIRVRVDGAPVEVPLWPGVRFGDALGGSVAMRALFERLNQAAAHHETLLLIGESGTGKEVLARAVHDASPRREGPFVVFDAGAVNATLIETELFGHVRGAFTGAENERDGLLGAANGGTIFIDEIGELPLELQPRLLRAIEARQYKPLGSNDWRPFDARIIAATHRDLPAAVAAGTFRQDLFYRLAVIQARVPALRDRKDDIELLTENFLAAQVPPKTVLDLAPGAMDLLAAHDWPGNVRELRNTVARLAHFPEADVAIELAGVEGEARAGFDALLAMPWKDARERVLDRFEAAYVRMRLRENEGNVGKTAAAMGISRQMLHRLVVRHGLRGQDDLVSRE